MRASLLQSSIREDLLNLPNHTVYLKLMIGGAPSVNPDHAAINVLAMVNYDKKASMKDLISIITGNFMAEGGKRLPLDRWLAGGRVATDKQEIDAFLWFDPHKRKDPFIGVNCNVCDRHLRVCGLFKPDPEKIDPVWKPRV